MNKPAHSIAAEEAKEIPARFTADEFMAMAVAGVFDSWVGKVELTEGVIVHMSPPRNPHFHCRRQLFLRLHAIFGDGIDGFIAGQEPTVRLEADTVRCPDVAILRDVGPIQDINKADDVRLAVEVSDSTLAEDRGPKRRDYAKAGIPHYWIVDVNGRTAELMTEPEADNYRRRRVIAFGEPIPVPGTDATITLD